MASGKEGEGEEKGNKEKEKKKKKKLDAGKRQGTSDDVHVWIPPFRPPVSEFSRNRTGSTERMLPVLGR